MLHCLVSHMKVYKVEQREKVRETRTLVMMTDNAMVKSLSVDRVNEETIPQWIPQVD